jgi:signal transduction histidine kinase
MPDTGSLRRERKRGLSPHVLLAAPPSRHLSRLELAWGAFALANLAAMALWPSWETIPFHFIWVSLTLLYGYRIWGLQVTAFILALVAASTGLLILDDAFGGDQLWGELFEVPLMSAMFLAMVWHARRRLVAMEELQRLSEANLMLLDRERRFIQDASHDLRTPITVALGHAELIQRAAPDKLAAEDAAVVVDELLRLRRLADRLLVLAAVEHPGFLHTVRVELEPLVVETLRRWSPTPRRWTLGEVDEATVDADRDRVQLALDALIENAVKHTNPDDSIELSLRREPELAALTVSDTGTGIAPEALERIFDRFARADSSRSRDRGGFGLGLSVVKAVAEAHSGSMEVRSVPGQGSVFTIRLPLAPVRAPTNRRATKGPAADRPATQLPVG